MKNTILALLFSILSTVLFSQMTNFVGIGARLQMDSTLNYHAAKITAFIPGGSAETSGLMVNDLIVKVDDKATNKLSLKEMTELIVGEVGTTVKIEVKRNGTAKIFNMKRKKIEASTYFYSSEVKSDFSTAICKLLNDAAYDFSHIVDTNTFSEEGEGWGGRRIYPCKVQVPGTVKTVIQSSFGYTCRIKVGEYKTFDEVNKKGEFFVNQLKTCFPKFYFFPKSGEGMSFSIQVGSANDKGYTSAIMVIYPVENKETHVIELFCRVETGSPSFFNTLSSKADGSEFGLAVNKIYADILNKFEKIKSTEYKSDDVFNPTYWYEINVPVPGAYNFYVDAGSVMSIKADECIANFYYGESHQLAEEAFYKYAEMLMNGFGSEFVTTADRPYEIMEPVVPKKAEKVLFFLQKKERGYETLGVCAIVLNQESDGKFRTYITFHKTGM
ncbi:MAG: PDZ domain-containing protein [Bacteroidota bacterium]